ncbi:GntR family transcriptional regulator [Rhodococcus sp. NPDC058505]|uniref:GntR family transcriptional regulator n=1 Tax=unclassified Rhodococcus (in: high G+C Gram-positive bacteria) TaxID=192944 RepID=UPI00366A3C79
MRIDIDPAAATAPFEQVKLQILEQVRDGGLIAGTKLPTVRALAEQLGLAANTVAKAYRELEAMGAIETRGRLGSFVAATGDASRGVAARAATEYVATVRSLGLSDGVARSLVEAAIRGA